LIKKLGRYIKGYWALTIVTPIMVLMESLLEIYIPLLMSSLIDEGIEVGDMNAIRHYGFILIGAAFVSLIFGVGASVTAPFASAGFAKNLRKAMYYKVQDFDFQSIDKFSTSSIITRLTTDVSNVQQSFQMLTRICVRAPAMLIFALIASFSINKDLSLVFLLVLPIILIASLALGKFVIPLFQRIFKKYDKLNNVVQENLHAARVVKSYNRQKYESDKFVDSSENIYKDFVKAEKTMAWIPVVMQFCMYVCMILICWFGAKMIVASGNNAMYGLTTGQLMSIFTYIMQILMSLMMLSMVFVMVLMSKASADRIIEILDEESHIQDPENPVMEVKNGNIDFDNVTFKYLHENENGLLTDSDQKSRNVLEGINLHIKQGMTVGILGGTGSSKSSLVQLIPRLYDVLEGSVKVGGVDVRDYNIEVLRDAVSMVLQKNILFSGTIADNLRWGNENATLDEMKHACDVACATEFIESFPDKFESKIEQGGTNVSGGQKQRLCIARALLKSPKILILDDSTSACDMATDAKIRKAFRDEMPDVTKIIIAQRISSIMDSDMIVVLDDGKINGLGTHDELLKSNEIYKEVYYTQQKKGGEE